MLANTASNNNQAVTCQFLGHYITCCVTPRNMSLYHRPCDTLQFDLRGNDITNISIVYHSRLLQLATVLTDLMLQATTRYNIT